MNNIATKITLKQREAKAIVFNISGTFDLSGATFQFGMKKTKNDETCTIIKAHVDFDLTDIAERKIKIQFSEADLDIDQGKYIGELKTTFTAANIDRSSDLTIKIDESVLA